MNNSNRYGVENMARQRQAEIEKQLRLAAELRSGQPKQPRRQMKIKWAAIGATAISLMGTIAFVLIAHAH